MSFKRSLGRHHVFSITVGAIISSAYFLGNGYLLQKLGPFACLNFLIGGLITYVVMNCLADLIVAEEKPHHGSFINYVARYFSPTFACGVGWAYCINWVVFMTVECIASGILLVSFIPEIPIYCWSLLSFGFISYLNLGHVKILGTASFWLTFTHTMLFIGFPLLALLIYFGWIGSEKQFLGLQYIWGSKTFFPNGIFVFLSTMIIFILNFVGFEVIGMSAAESADIKKGLHSLVNKITLFVSVLFFFPMFLIALIFPWQEGTADASIFAVALERYGLHSIASVFTFLIVAGSLTCANSALYASTRSLHAMSLLKMCPKYIDKFNKHGVPVRASITLIIAVLLLLQSLLFFPVHDLYIHLLIIAGFAGGLTWIAICLAHLKSRKNKSIVTILTMLALSVFTLSVLLDPDLRISFYVGIVFVTLPMLIYRFVHRNTHVVKN